MNGAWIFVLVVTYIALIIFTAWLANEKHRSVGTWVFLAMIFPLFSLIAIAGATTAQTEKTNISDAHSLKCPFCSYQNGIYENIIEHIEDVHPDKINKSATGTKCPLCGWECETEESYENHLKWIHFKV